MTRTKLFRKIVDNKYQNRLGELKNKLINFGMYPGQNHNYCYYLSLICDLQNHKSRWEEKYYREYLAAYYIQKVWKRYLKTKRV